MPLWKNNTFSNITSTEIEKQLKKLYSSKFSPKSDIPTKIVRDHFDIFTLILHQEFNKSLPLGKFPSEMEFAWVTPVFKKEDRTNKENYRPIITLSHLPKVFERCCINNFLYFLMRYVQNTNADLEKALMFSIALLIYQKRGDNP